MRTADDASLLERVQEYDPAALAEIYDRYAGRIYHYIYYRLGDEALAEDLTGTVFARMLEAIRASKSWNSSFSGWLYRIAHNLVVDHVRRAQQSALAAGGPALTRADQDPACLVERRIEEERLRQALQRLTCDQSQVIALKFAEGLSNVEIARIMGKSEGAVKSLQFRAVAALRRMLEAEE